MLNSCFDDSICSVNQLLFFHTIHFQCYMKSSIFIMLIVFSCASSRYTALKPGDIISLHPVFKDSTFYHHGGYDLANGEHIVYDKQDSFLKQYLAEHINSVNTIQEDTNTSRVTQIFQNSKPFKPIPLPIKVAPFSEFGYMKTKGGKVISYAMQMNSFHDLTNNRIYVDSTAQRKSENRQIKHDK